MKKLILNLVVGTFILLNCYGCVALLAGAAGGAGTAVWLSGKLVQQVNVSYDGTIHGVKTALNAMNLKITKEITNADVTSIRSYYTDGRKIWIDIRPVTQTSTRLEVRVGAFSDKVASEDLLKKIISYL